MNIHRPYLSLEDDLPIWSVIWHCDDELVGALDEVFVKLWCRVRDIFNTECDDHYTEICISRVCYGT